jgi:VCBS repeat-containing protein
MSRARLLLAMVLATTALTCGDVPVTAPADSTIRLIANPTFIAANGGVSVVTAIVVEPAGTFVPDGTEVFFFTNLGTIEPSRQTKDGVARVNFVADSRSGTANVTAISGGASSGGGGEGGGGDVEIVIGSARPERIVVTANPPGMRSNGFSQITANVFDDNGNPVANVPVIFTVGSGSVGGPEYLDSGGSQQFTDTNGQAFDTLRSRRPLSEGGDATVTATAADGTTATVTVEINGGEPTVTPP